MAATAPNPPAAAQITGGQVVVDALKREGVDTIFGLISIHMLPIYDALRSDPSVRLIIPRHEMSGGFMADAYARVSGKPGVYLTSTGPGAANSMGAILESWGARSQTLQITGQIESYILDKGKGSLHEVRDQLGMFSATGTDAVRAGKVGEIAHAIQKAFYNMRSHRPRPQVIEIPIDQQNARTSAPIPDPLPIALPQPAAAALDHAVEVLTKAAKPVIWVGGGVNTSGAQAELRRVAEALGAAVYLTRGGRGAIPEDHPLVVGNYFGERPARVYLQAADAVLAVGTDFSWHTTSQWGLALTKNLIRIDLDLEELQHNYPAAVAINSDAKPALAGIADRLEAAKHAPAQTLLNEVAMLRKEVREEFVKHRPLTAAMMDIIDQNTSREKIVVTDATIPAYWGANQYLPVYAERGFVTPRLAAIGPGYPMALGAQAVDPNRPVLCIVGDGGFMMHIGDLATAVQEKLNVVLLVFNNYGYGILKRIQEKMMGGRTFAVDLHTPDFVKVAEGMGMAGETVKQPEELGPALKRAYEAKAPYLIDVLAPFDA